ncbi:MAG: heme exporter protein CcmB [Promethearchaeota archaeon]|jgi:ABC-type transport system involved in cytochrome c biogenesis permease component
MKALKTLLLKDLKSEIRQINDLFSIFLFEIVSIFIFSSVYNFTAQVQNMPLEIFVIENWIIIFFTLIYIMVKLFVKEKESGTLGGLTTSPVSGNIILLSKIIFCLILMILVEAILFLFSTLLSAPAIVDGVIITQINLNPSQLVNYIAFGIILPTFDLAICGSIVSAFSMYVKNKSFVLPILLFPLILPITTPIMSLNMKLLEGELISAVYYELIFLGAHITLMISIISLLSQILLYD